MGNDSGSKQPLRSEGKERVEIEEFATGAKVRGPAKSKGARDAAKAAIKGRKLQIYSSQ